MLSVFALSAFVLRQRPTFWEAKMSLRFEIADWKFELTWDGIGCLPIEQDSLEITAGLAAEQSNNRSHHAEANEDRYIQEEKATCYELY